MSRLDGEMKDTMAETAKRLGLTPQQVEKASARFRMIEARVDEFAKRTSPNTKVQGMAVVLMVGVVGAMLEVAGTSVFHQEAACIVGDVLRAFPLGLEEEDQTIH